MNSTLTREARPRTHPGLISAVIAGVAICLAVPSVALASSARPAVHRATVVAHHDPRETPTVQVSGAIVSFGSGTVVVQDRDGFWRTIVLGTSTSYSEGPMDVQPALSASDLSLGATIVADGAVDANHLFLDAKSIRIQLARSRGVVQSVSSSTIVLEGDGSVSSRSIDLNSQTVYFSHEAVVTPSPVIVGTDVEGFGIIQPDGSLLGLYVGVGTSHQGFDHASDFGFTLPNRMGPHHYRGHLSSR